MLFSVWRISLTGLKVPERFYLRVNSEAPQHLYRQTVRGHQAHAASTMPLLMARVLSEICRTWSIERDTSWQSIAFYHYSSLIHAAGGRGLSAFSFHAFFWFCPLRWLSSNLIYQTCAWKKSLLPSQRAEWFFNYFILTFFFFFFLHIQKGKANEWLPWTTLFGGELQRGWCCPKAMTAAGISAWGTGMGSWWSPIHNIVIVSVAILSASRLHRCSYISTGVQDYRPWILAFILWIISYK